MTSLQTFFSPSRTHLHYRSLSLFTFLSLSLFLFRRHPLFAKNNVNYVDEDFPPGDESVGAGIPANMVVSWRRAAEFMTTPHIVEGGIEPGDISQGSLGDCW